MNKQQLWRLLHAHRSHAVINKMAPGVSVQAGMTIRHAMELRNMELIRAVQEHGQALSFVGNSFYEREVDWAIDVGDAQADYLQFLLENYHKLHGPSMIDFSVNEKEGHPKTLALLWRYNHHWFCGQAILEATIKATLRKNPDEHLLCAYAASEGFREHHTYYRSAAEFCRTIKTAQAALGGWESCTWYFGEDRHIMFDELMGTAMPIYRNAVEDTNLELMTCVTDMCKKWNAYATFSQQKDVHKWFLKELLSKPFRDNDLRKRVLIQVMEDFNLKTQQEDMRYDYVLYLLDDPDLLAHPVPTVFDRATFTLGRAHVLAVAETLNRLLDGLVEYGAMNVPDDKLSELLNGPLMEDAEEFLRSSRRPYMRYQNSPLFEQIKRQSEDCDRMLNLLKK